MQLARILMGKAEEETDEAPAAGREARAGGQVKEERLDTTIIRYRAAETKKKRAQDPENKKERKKMEPEEVEEVLVMQELRSVLAHRIREAKKSSS
jgi:hypothetical protein